MLSSVIDPPIAGSNILRRPHLTSSLRTNISYNVISVACWVLRWYFSPTGIHGECKGGAQTFCSAALENDVLNPTDLEGQLATGRH